MGDLGHDLEFGAFLTPRADTPEAVVALAELCDRLGLELLGIQDHPYQPSFLETWTLLSALSSRTTGIKLVPDVANVVLRPPAVLARAAASLDILSGGRVELGVGAGAFPGPVAAMGGPSLSPGERVDALEEAIAVMRALWAPGPDVRLDGRFHRLDGARPGPFPTHPIGVWIGAYKPRMLRLTGRVADGWLPTLAYASPEEIVTMGATIDAAAEAAGRDPAAIRRLYNIEGRFSGTGGFLQGPPRTWAKQLAGLTLDHGFSGYLLAPGPDAVGDLRRFAEEVAPAVREAVARERTPSDAPRPAPAEIRPAARGELDEATRPRVSGGSAPAASGPGRAGQETLVQIHEHLRRELRQLQDAVEAVAGSHIDPAAARGIVNQLSLRQNDWSLSAFCASYCRIVGLHHTIEDQHLFTQLGRADPELKPVLTRLGEEHEVVAELLFDLDEALVAMIADAGRMADVRRAADRLAAALLSHLAYEEEELLEPIGRLEILV